MGKGNKSVSHVHPIIKHMNKLGGNPEIKYDPISHDEKGMGRGGHLGSDSDLNYNGSLTIPYEITKYLTITIMELGKILAKFMFY